MRSGIGSRPPSSESQHTFPITNTQFLKQSLLVFLISLFSRSGSYKGSEGGRSNAVKLTSYFLLLGSSHEAFVFVEYSNRDVNISYHFHLTNPAKSKLIFIHLFNFSSQIIVSLINCYTINKNFDLLKYPLFNNNNANDDW